MAPTTISLDSDDEDVHHVHATGRGASKDAPVELSSDDDADVPTAGSCAGAAGPSRAGPSTKNTAAGNSSKSALVMDLTGEEESVPGCGMCGKLTGARESYRLDECGHDFCEGCVRSFVTKKVSETLAHEVGCPKCGRQLSIGNVNELAKSSSGQPGAKRPRPGAPMAWRGGGPAALLAHLAGVGGMLDSGRVGKRVAGNPAATKRIMKELQALQCYTLLPHPLLHPLTSCRRCSVRARRHKASRSVYLTTPMRTRGKQSSSTSTRVRTWRLT